MHVHTISARVDSFPKKKKKDFATLRSINHYLRISSRDLYASKDSIFSKISTGLKHIRYRSLWLPWECRDFPDCCNISRNMSLQSHGLSRRRSPAILSDKFRNGRRECERTSSRRRKNNKRETALILCPAMTRAISSGAAFLLSRGLDLPPLPCFSRES